MVFIMKIDYMKLGVKIGDARRTQGITQERLSEYADISVSHLSYIENGTTKVSLQTLVRIAKVIDIGLDELLDLELGKRAIYLTIREIDQLFKDCTEEKKHLLIKNINILKDYDLENRL